LSGKIQKMKRWLIITSISFFITAASTLLTACKKTDHRKKPTSIPFNVPSNFPQPVYDFNANPLTKEGVQLGQKLFYEEKISRDGFTSCASCHQQMAAFTTYKHDRSHGYNGSHTLRNAVALSNLAWQTEFRLDGSAANLEQAIQDHMQAPDEMAYTMPEIIAILKADAKYKQLFDAAYGDEHITSQRIVNAIKQFVLSMVSANSKYDKVRRGLESFSVYEELGYQTFKAKCASCHIEPLFTDLSFKNIGLPVDPHLTDYGRMRVTGNKADSLKFRVPSLRNVDLSSYYFHDGRYSSIQKCIEHYRTGIQHSSTLDPALINGISITPTEEINLVAFLRALSDSSYIEDSKFGEPTF
jgi:cytochrome c peroxidase